MKFSRSSQSGSSLIEVTFATAVVSLVLVALLSSVISSVQNSRVALEQTQSTQLANEVLEWFKGQREVVGWGEFHSSLDVLGSPVNYCVTTLPDSFPVLVGQTQRSACPDGSEVPGTNFKRTVEITVISDTEVRIRSFVSRPGKAATITTSLDTVLTRWE